MSKPKPMKVDEILRLACIYAEQDREGFIAAHEGMKDDEASKAAVEYLKTLQAYRRKRWGRTGVERLEEESTRATVDEVRERAEGRRGRKKTREK